MRLTYRYNLSYRTCGHAPEVDNGFLGFYLYNRDRIICTLGGRLYIRYVRLCINEVDNGFLGFYLYNRDRIICTLGGRLYIRYVRLCINEVDNGLLGVYLCNGYSSYVL